MCEKRKRNEVKGEGEREEENRGVKRRFSSRFRDLMEFYRYSKNEWLFNVYHLEKKLNESESHFYAYIEPHHGTLKEWMKTHSPLSDDDRFDRINFLYPMRRLIRNIIAMKETYKDFELSSENIVVTNRKEGLSFMVLCTKEHTEVGGSDNKGMLQLSSIIEEWFDRYNADKSNPDLQMFLHCLGKFENRHLELLYRCPIFYQGVDRKRLFDMAMKIDYMLEVKRGNISGADSIIEAYHHMNLEINHEDWFTVGMSEAEEIGCLTHEEVWVHPVTDFVLARRERVKDIYGLVRLIRNMGAHIHQNFRFPPLKSEV